MTKLFKGGAQSNNINFVIVFIILINICISCQNNNKNNEKIIFKKTKIAENIYMNVPSDCQIKVDDQIQYILFKHNKFIKIVDCLVDIDYINDLESYKDNKIIKQDSINSHYFIFLITKSNTLVFLLKLGEEENETSLFPHKVNVLLSYYENYKRCEDSLIYNCFKSVYELNKKGSPLPITP